MMMRQRVIRLLWLGLLLFTGFGGSVALAQPARLLRDELPAAALADWDAARELYAARNYGSALVHFQRVHATSQNPRTLFNIGVCHKELTQYARAIGVWEHELSMRERLPAADVAKLEGAIRALRPFVSTLELRSNEAGARLSIDGIEVGRNYARPYRSTWAAGRCGSRRPVSWPSRRRSRWRRTRPRP
jgi:tetratricopeptide (TPR) repeat protein